MSERYSKLYTLPENLYAKGSPVVISAGALLKDNQSGKIIVQLKLKNIANKAIKAVVVSVSAFDPIGNPLGKNIEYRYLDLNVMRNEEFGAKNPLFLSEAATRQFSVAVTEIAFTDNSVWKTDNSPWESLPVLATLEAELGDPQLAKQYRIKYGWGYYAPTEHKDLWFCACGELKHRDEDTCYSCQKSITELKTLNLEELRAECDERLAAEAEQEAWERAEAEKRAAEEKIAAQKRAKKAKKTTAVCAVCAVVGIAAALVVTKIIIPNQNYNNAVALMEAGQYEEAIAAFEAMNGYKDSVEQITACETAILDGKYDNAVALMEKAEYSKAIIAFQALQGYRDSEEQILACQYSQAVRYMESGQAITAYNIFIKLGNYSDSKEKAQQIAESEYQKAYETVSERVDGGSYTSAITYYKEWTKKPYSASYTKQELIDYYNYARLMLQYKDGAVINISDYISALKEISYTFKNVGERLDYAQSVLDSFKGVWIKSGESGSEACAFEIWGSYAGTGWAELFDGSYKDGYWADEPLYAFVKNGKFSYIQIYALSSLNYRFKLNNSGKLVVETYSWDLTTWKYETGDYLGRYNGTYYKQQ